MRKYQVTAESVTEGHPDKLCDQISDGILDQCLRQDKDARVAIETMASKNTVMIAGEMTAEGDIDPVAIARQIIKKIGYDSEPVGMDGDSCLILTNIHNQSADIAQSVTKDDTIRLPQWRAGCRRCAWIPPEPGTQERHVERHLGAGDQGVMIGYATDETPECMPMPFVLATRLSRKLADLRRSGGLPWLRPDGKSQVTMAYDEKGEPQRIESIVLSAQHDESIGLVDLQQALLEDVIQTVIDPRFITVDTKIRINPSGRFVIGGPLGDTGLTGRKLMVDTYGSAARHGGGAFSGKDPTKVDRSGAYMARYVAKNIVAAGLAKRCEVSLAYAIGQEEPEMIALNTFGTAIRDEGVLTGLIDERCSFAVADIIDGLDLCRPIYEKTAAYGHFGRDEFPWEKVDGLDSVK